MMQLVTNCWMVNKCSFSG